MTLTEAEDLAARTLAAIEHYVWDTYDDFRRKHWTADRERVASDLAGLRDCFPLTYDCDMRHARRYTASLRRTAALYGVTP